MGSEMLVRPRLIEGFYPDGELQTATPLRRLSGAILDVVLVFATLFIGYLIWFLIVVGRGQTPGKQLLGMYIMREDGSRAGGWYTLLREIVVEGLLFGIVNSFTFAIAGIVGALWCTWDRDRQCLWDKITSTYVAYSPEGRRPLTKPEFLARSSLPPRDRQGRI
jgi:uncharacterized RDD family membrane protein YckC